MSKREREETESVHVPKSTLSVFSSNAPSAHTIGICAVAMSAKEDRLIAAREDGSLALCKVVPIPFRCTAAIIPLLRTGSMEGRTVTSIVYALGGSVIVASYLSGQIVVYDESTLAPLHVAERVGGAVWSMTSIRTNIDNTEEELVCACADGSWYHFSLLAVVNKSDTVSSSTVTRFSYKLNLVQVFPKVVGAHRALFVALCGKMLVGSDDCGNVVCWKVLDSGVRGYEQLWLTRLPKGGYAKTITFDAETNVVVAGTSLGDVVFINGEKGDIINSYTNHHGPITSVITAGRRTVLATGWHESLRAYRFVEGKWIPAEVRRRTHYHEATQLLNLSKSNAVLSASRDGTFLVASMNDNFSSPPKYVQPAPQQYCYAANASVMLTVCGSRVEMYHTNEAMSFWSPLAVYTAHGDCGIQGIWCDADLTRIVVATTTRVVVLRCTRSSTSVISLTKITDVNYSHTHAVVMVGQSDVYLVHDMNVLSHIAINETVTSVIESHINLPIKATALGMLETQNALIVASAVDETAAIQVPLNKDGSFKGSTAEPINSFRADAINNSAGVAMYQGRIFDLSSKKFAALPETLPSDSVLFTRLQRNNKNQWVGYSPRGLVVSTMDKWWLVDSDRIAKKPVDSESLNRSMNVVLSDGPRETYVAAFGCSEEGKVIALQRDISSEVESLPLMWKIRRFGN